jgi:hypothetical protein
MLVCRTLILGSLAMASPACTSQPSGPLFAQPSDGPCVASAIDPDRDTIEFVEVPAADSSFTCGDKVPFTVKWHLAQPESTYNRPIVSVRHV